MFEGFFGLSENPFNLTPDPKFLYMSDVHKEALSHLQYGIEQRKGFVLITGEVGTGKTTICRSLLSMLSKKTRTALVLNPSLSDVELLQTINQDFGIDSSSGSKKILLDKLYNFLIDVFVRGENAALIIDECQNLTPEVLEQIRLLSNLETEKEKLLQIIMIGQPELARMLQAPGLRQINDRIVLRYHIWPLSLSDTKKYLQHRMEVAGAYRTDVFTPMAVREIYRYSGGLPRKMNALAERGLLMAYLRGKRRVTMSIVAAAIRELKGNYGENKKRHRLLIPVFAGIFAACVIAAAFCWPDAFSKISEYAATPVVAKDKEIPRNENTQQAPVPVSRVDYVIPQYEEALEILSLVPEGLVGPDILNLHPKPSILKLLGRPAIASVDKGYVILLYATDDFVRVVGRDKAVVEIPMKEFIPLYRWNVMIACTRDQENPVYTMGDSGPEVERIQSTLAQAGYQAERSGFYDDATASAIERMQEDFGLKRDGVAGEETLVVFDMVEKGMQ
ncbi:MAG TPA: AAA family ATPase [Deltaproteobacteria bacterium]|nr:AAA family ATPase [Deltaproteobacteria bacterium]